MDREDEAHQRSLAALERGDLHLVIPAMVIAEVAFAIADKIGALAEAEFLASLGDFEIEAPHPSDWERIGELVARYADFPLGAVDASVIALAERLDTRLIITLDQRHFRAVRPRHTEAFELLPALN